MPVRPKLRIAGLDVEVVSTAEAERASVTVCVPWSWKSDFADDMRSACVACGVDVRHRPYAPVKPPKVCLSCAPDWIMATRH